MQQFLANEFWAHPVTIIAAAVAIIIILIWMTGSGSRQRFIVIKRNKETEQLSRDLGRIASALEKIARQREIPVDYVGRPVPPGWEETISSGEPAEEQVPAAPVGAGNSAAKNAAGAAASNASNTAADPRSPAPAPAVNPADLPNPLGGTAGLLGGKKKLDLPNPLYRPK